MTDPSHASIPQVFAVNANELARMSDRQDLSFAIKAGAFPDLARFLLDSADQLLAHPHTATGSVEALVTLLLFQMEALRVTVRALPLSHWRATQRFGPTGEKSVVSRSQNVAEAAMLLKPVFANFVGWLSRHIILDEITIKAPRGRQFAKPALRALEKDAARRCDELGVTPLHITYAGPYELPGSGVFKTAFILNSPEATVSTSQ